MSETDDQIKKAMKDVDEIVAKSNTRFQWQEIVRKIAINGWAKGFGSGAEEVLKLVKDKNNKRLKELIKIHKV